jgi:thiol-disulfide isomerase/thioredoxin
MVIRIALLVALTLLPGPVRQESPASSLALRDLGGRTIKLDSFRGKVVLLNFWATWCPPCRAEIPDLVALQKKYGDKGLQVVGVTAPPYTRAEVSKFVKRAKVNYPILFGTEGLAARLAGTEVLPATILLDREGRVHTTIEGILTPEEVDEKILPLLDRR